MLKIAIIGCGKIADAHAAQIRRIKGCELVAVCDREELMARQLSERLRLPGYYSDVAKLLTEARPNVVHITTPPQSHFELARQCLENGVHVYVEKPFTLNTAEAERLIDMAKEKRLKIIAGHNDQFHHSARRMRELIKEGYLGGAPVHMESYYGYELVEDSSYAKALLADKEHWVRKLPGQLLHNVISHGIARVAEFFQGENVRVMACGFSSPTLQRMGEFELVDELRVILVDEHGTTAYFTFSSRMRPSVHQFRIFGPRNGLMIDQDNETLIRLPGKRYKSFAEHFFSPLVLAKQYVGNTVRSMRLFLANDFHQKASLKFLLERFYESITDQAPVPLSSREILLTSRIMDSIFEQLRNALASRMDGTTGDRVELVAAAN
jgi:predicted dehydrogenase